MDTVKLLVKSGANLNAQDKVCVYLSVLLTSADYQCFVHEKFISTEVWFTYYG